MNFRYDYTEKEALDYEPLVKKANRFLEEEIGEPSNRLSALWKFLRDSKDRPSFYLQLRDDSYGGVSQEFFDPVELGTEKEIRRRFHRLWGDVLGESSKLQSAKVDKLLEQLDKEERENGNQHRSDS